MPQPFGSATPPSLLPPTTLPTLLPGTRVKPVIPRVLPPFISPHPEGCGAGLRPMPHRCCSRFPPPPPPLKVEAVGRPWIQPPSFVTSSPLRTTHSYPHHQWEVPRHPGMHYPPRPPHNTVGTPFTRSQGLYVTDTCVYMCVDVYTCSSLR